MSKFVKDLIKKDLQDRLDGVDDALLVNVIGMDANTTVELRRKLREKGISLVVVKNSLARRVFADKELDSVNPLFTKGLVAVAWGGDSIVDFVKRHRDEPFFLYWSPEAVHSPNTEVPGRLMNRTTATGKRRKLAGAIVSVDDFLAVSEMHIADDIKSCVQALHERNVDTLDRTAGAYGRGGGTRREM